jgi:integrase
MARFFVTLPSGERKRQHIILKDRDEVMRRMQEEMAQANKGLPMNHERRTVTEWLRYWLEEVDPKNVKETTLAMHEMHVEKNIIPEIGHVSLQKLGVVHVRTMIERWEKRGMGTRSIQIARNVLSAALRDAMKREYIYRNVARLVDVPKGDPRPRRVWTSEEVRTYGLRRGEACGLLWKNIDFDANTIYIRQQLTVVRGVMQLGTLKTPESRRDLTLTPALKEALQAEYERRGCPSESEFVFVTQVGTPVYTRSLLRTFKYHAAMAGLKPITLHEIRHTVATLLKEAGVPMKEIQTILGHSSIMTTMDIYAHSTTTEQSKAITALMQGYGI